MDAFWLTLDAHGLALAHKLSAPGVDAFFAAITWLGSFMVLLPIALGWAWCPPAMADAARRHFPLAALLASAFAAHTLKILIDRPRPDHFAPLIGLPADASFPSAHTMQITAMIMAMLLTLSLNRGAALGHWAAGLGLIGLVGYSRIHLQVHFPTDVIAGMLLASLLTLGIHRYRRLTA